MKRYQSCYPELDELLKLNESSMPQAMKNMAEIFKQNNIDFCFIGGSILPYYKYNRTTDDIDILVSIKDKEKFLKLIGRYFKRAFEGATRAFYWNIPKVKLDVIYSTEVHNKKGPAYLEPKQVKVIKNNLPILDLKYLISYKLSAGMYGIARISDLGDVQRLIQYNNLERNFGKLFRRDLRNKYLEIWDLTYSKDE